MFAALKPLPRPLPETERGGREWVCFVIFNIFIFGVRRGEPSVSPEGESKDSPLQ